MGFKKKNVELQSMPPEGTVVDGDAKDTRKEATGENEKDVDGSDVEVNLENMELKRELGLVGGISFIVGCIVGSGIFVSPAGVLGSTGSVGLSLVVWVGAGLIALLGSLCYCELGTLIPKSGGEYSYLRKAFGNVPAFLFTWVSVVLVRPSSLAVMSLTFGTYFATLFPVCGSPKFLPELAAIVCLLTIMLLNCYSTKLSAQLQIITTVAKVAALLVIVVGGLIKLAEGNTKELNTGFTGSTTDPSTIALAFYDALWAYDGWNNLNYVTEELKNPSK
ncbi:b(0,+)-type amino acid transporter 1-like [Aplysia californica]|uniref:B(0,+)-type amino acid transporter 1-like n=1 Tax=Aplysia californica TaxID=6500 RepID=A0ABM1VZ11_APLCA|nr:b(0,+)-type amino acid transporter 1-like [Aplysia californica]